MKNEVFNYGFKQIFKLIISFIVENVIHKSAVLYNNPGKLAYLCNNIMQMWEKTW